MGTLTGPRKTAPFGGLLIRTTGGRFVPEPPRMVMETGSDVVEAPPLSVAFAVRRMLVPGGALLQVRRKPRVPGGMQAPGAGSTTTQLVTTPRLVAFAKNSTLTTEPSASFANAVSRTSTGAA